MTANGKLAWSIVLAGGRGPGLVRATAVPAHAFADGGLMHLYHLGFSLEGPAGEIFSRLEEAMHLGEQAFLGAEGPSVKEIPSPAAALPAESRAVRKTAQKANVQPPKMKSPAKVENLTPEETPDPFAAIAAGDDDVF